MSKVDLKNYTCVMPFYNLEIHSKDRYLCCASWIPKTLPINSTPKEAWESDLATDIRNSVIDGSFKYCDRKQCPHLQELEKSGVLPHENTNTIFEKRNLPDEWKTKIELFKSGDLQPPTNIQFSFDKTCNLKCPSCRLKIIVNNSDEIEQVHAYIKLIEEQYGNDVTNLYITGSGDPFVSVGFREFLINFDKTKWPKLKNIHLHTNATKWTKQLWNEMKNIHPYVHSCEISIDAATKDTYENKVRLGGNWDVLLDNLKFISTINTLKYIKLSFVVQTHNYKEMKLFYNMCNDIFENRAYVFFGKINNWGTFTEEEYLEHKIWDSNHPLHEDFLSEVRNLLPTKNSYNNLQEFLPKYKSFI